jgi:hypothetical protein
MPGNRMIATMTTGSLPRLLFLLLFLTASADAAPRRRAVTAPQPAPPCIITGTSAVTFTRDEGRTLAPSAVPLRGLGYTYGLATLDTPDTVMAWHKDDLLLSSDAGCSWRVVATMTGWAFPPRLTAARGGRVYAWADNREFLARWDARGAKQLKAPPFVGLEADPKDGDHVRAGSYDGSMWESRDAGETWTANGFAPATNVYRFAFDPNNLDHVIAGVVVDGARVSFDGGHVWATPSGLPARANVFNAVISPVDGNVVWAMAIDLANSTRHIYLSRDGGLTFTRVIDAGPDVTLVNGPIMAAHPANPNVLYFVFGSSFQGYGTDLYRYDAFTGSLTKTHSDHHDINAIAFDRRDPHLMYLGLEREER